MDEIFGWILTEHRGNLTIEKKEMEVILMEDLGYMNVSYLLDETSEHDEFCDTSYDYDSYSGEPDEECVMMDRDESIDDSELEELARFFVDGYEIERQGDNMVFLLDEASANISERVLEKLSNLKISR